MIGTEAERDIWTSRAYLARWHGGRGSAARIRIDERCSRKWSGAWCAAGGLFAIVNDPPAGFVRTLLAVPYDDAEPARGGQLPDAEERR